MDKYVKSLKDGLSETITFFGNKKKPDREIWVLKEFLEYLPVTVQDIDVTASKAEPNDAFYKDIGFQIKEIQTEGRKRGKEYKEKLNSITDKTKPEDFLESYSPIHVPLSESITIVGKELERHRNDKYKNNTSDMNVLVYLNLSGTTYTNDSVDAALIGSELHHWKSVSLVTNNCAVVLSCTDSNNKLLTPLVGKFYVKN